MFEAVTFAETHNVEPVPGPALAVLRTCQQSIDQFHDRNLPLEIR